MSSVMLDTVEKVTQAFPTREFSVTNDRCDRCPAEAMFAIVKNDKELLFCRHHFSKHEDAIVVDGWEIFCNATGLQRISS